MDTQVKGFRTRVDAAFLHTASTIIYQSMNTIPNITAAENKSVSYPNLFNEWRIPLPNN